MTNQTGCEQMSALKPNINSATTPGRAGRRAMAGKKLFHTAKDDRGALRCDNPECGFRYREALPWGAGLIGHECPSCGDNMLTREDFERSEKFHRKIAWINKWFGWLGTHEPPTDGHMIAVRHRPHGVDIKTDRTPPTTPRG